MSTKTLRILCCFLCLALLPNAKSIAQEGGDHDRDHPGTGAGGPGGPGGLGGPGGPRHSRHSGHDSDHDSDHNKGRAPTTTQRNALQFGPVGRWWDDRSVVQAIGLRREQQKRMDAIFDRNKPAILDSYKVFLRAQTDLTAANKDPQAGKDRLFAAIDAVNQARASLQKATSAMLLQIKQEMDPEQVNKLENIQ
jgi:hypothetical protein